MVAEKRPDRKKPVKRLLDEVAPRKTSHTIDVTDDSGSQSSSSSDNPVTRSSSTLKRYEVDLTGDDQATSSTSPIPYLAARNPTPAQQNPISAASSSTAVR
jgi:hypothetical protein